MSIRLKAHITLCVFFSLRWLSRPTQMKCARNANGSIPILHLVFLFLLGIFRARFKCYVIFSPEI